MEPSILFLLLVKFLCLPVQISAILMFHPFDPEFQIYTVKQVSPNDENLNEFLSKLLLQNISIHIALV